MVLDSDAVDDDCGICKGDGTQCKKIDDTFSSTKGHGMFTKILIGVLPKWPNISFGIGLENWLKFCIYRLCEGGDDTEGSAKYYL